MTVKEVIEYYSDLTNKIDKEIDRKRYIYTIHDNEFFANSFLDNPTQLQKIYWEEILQRAHWAGLSSLIRNLKWTQGLKQAINDNNLLSFTGNLRSLIESSGDNFLSLLSVPSTLADNFKLISIALQGDIENNKIVTSKELEELLIHFAYGRKISQEEIKTQGKLPKYQNAKPAAEYIKGLDNKVDNGPVSKLYSILCQFAHPAAQSIHFLFDMKIEDNAFKFSYSSDPDNSYIQRFLNQFSDEILKSLQYGFNPCIVTLKTLNYFNYELTKTPAVNNINLDQLKVWQDIKQKLKRHCE